ncbi:MAG: hypothetical protein PHI34_12365 [Acidobacteriota bacterium]|nr:hypothetical protein [Acidobacteriota bacterium]
MPIIIKSDWDSQAVLAVSKRMPAEKMRKWETQAGKMFYKHRRATYHRYYIEKCYSFFINEMPTALGGPLPTEGANSSYVGPLAEVALFHLDGFFEAEKSAHDFVLSCLRTADVLNASAPDSLHEYSKHPGNYHCDPVEAERLLMSFWNKFGQPTKNYRDCFNHFVSLSGPTWQHEVNMRWRNGSWKAALYLPDNPEIKSYSKFTFGKYLDALEICANINDNTKDFLRLLMKICSTKWNASIENSEHFQFTIRSIKIDE